MQKSFRQSSFRILFSGALDCAQYELEYESMMRGPRFEVRARARAGAEDSQSPRRLRVSTATGATERSDHLASARSPPFWPRFILGDLSLVCFFVLCFLSWQLHQ